MITKKEGMVTLKVSSYKVQSVVAQSKDSYSMVVVDKHKPSPHTQAMNEKMGTTKPSGWQG